MLVGRLVRVTRYPVKSMAGEDRDAAGLDWQGMEGDRQYAFVKRCDRTRFPWLTGRDLSDLVRYRPRYADPERPRAAPVTVSGPDGACRAIDDPALLDALERASGRPLALMQLGTGAYDAMPVSVVTTASLAALDAAHGTALDPRRFRSNLAVESDRRDGDWVGRRLRFGEGPDAAELFCAHGVPRCAMVTVDPDTAERDPGVLRTVAQAFGNRLATYASVVRPGTVRVGDAVTLLN